ncbi:hypothetical protein [Pseudoalteromonas agarivorans]|uniref:Uncharacterized protein n=1 Tax=Pseudoalteromonas agarivorans DSM 14585 TaxID=1312369 RepID=A0ACA8DWS8_9GAMM|nr:hypothetical protein [Pseudoalteromonas agarivorans]ATC82647.1 hypothetical protein PAGA_a2364 [Pseudoalteromonas agarivorans DSM 14585]
MGLWSSVCSVVSSACSAIGSAVSRIGNSIASTATSIASLGVSLAAKVTDAIRSVGVSLGIIRPEDNLEELGEKAILSEKKPEDFDSINEYINHLNNNVTFDKDKFDRLDEKELLVRSSIGASITLKGINEKLDSVVTPEFMATVASQELETKEIVSTIKAYKENDLKLEDYDLYLNDELTLDETTKHSSALVEAYQKLEPELSIEEIENKVMGLSN